MDERVGLHLGVGSGLGEEFLTTDFYIRNFKPDRWPAGDPPAEAVTSFEKLASETAAAFSDYDGGPTKAWLLLNREHAGVSPLADRAFGKRAARELYDLRKDPFEMKNVAEDPEYAEATKDLESGLIAELKATGDPRASGGGDEFDRYSNLRSPGSRKPARGTSLLVPK